MEGWDRRRRGMGWTAACSEDPRCARGGGGGGGWLCVDTYASHGRTRTEKHRASAVHLYSHSRAHAHASQVRSSLAFDRGRPSRLPRFDLILPFESS